MAQKKSDGNNKAKKSRHVGRWIALVLFVFVGISAIGFAVYVNDYYHAAPSNEAYLEDAVESSVSQVDNRIAFGDPSADAGFILYPGAKVDYAAYAPMLTDLANDGVFCVVVQVPFNIAFFDAGAAQGVIDAYPNIGTWYVGGHSLGGVVASGWAASHADEVAGMVFLASYPTDDLPDEGLRVLSLYGSEDKVLNRDAYDQAIPRFPSGYTEVIIEGGNHAQFGNYGAQAGDGEAAISAQDQWKQAASAIAAFIHAEDGQKA